MSTVQFRCVEINGDPVSDFSESAQFHRGFRTSEDLQATALGGADQLPLVGIGVALEGAFRRVDLISSTAGSLEGDEVDAVIAGSDVLEDTRGHIGACVQITHILREIVVARAIATDAIEWGSNEAQRK